MNRYTYVKNNSINFNDPSGHKPSCSDDTFVNGKCLDAVGYLKYELQQTYKIKLRGTWKVDEITNLSEALERTATYVGGVDKLNAYFLRAVRQHDANATGIFIERVAAQRPYGKSVAVWCGGNTQNGCAKNTIIFGDDLFTMQYQDGKSLGAGRGGAAYPRPSTWSYDQKFQFSMAHEFGHIITDANPNSFTQYLLDNSDPSKTDGAKYEAMANEIALQVISGGNSFSDFSNPAVWGY